MCLPQGMTPPRMASQVVRLVGADGALHDRLVGLGGHLVAHAVLVPVELGGHALDLLAAGVGDPAVAVGAQELEAVAGRVGADLAQVA